MTASFPSRASFLLAFTLAATVLAGPGRSLAATAVPSTGELVDFSADLAPGQIKTKDCSYAIEEKNGEKVLKVELNPSKKFAFIRFLPPAAAWDLSKFEGVQMTITNAGTAPAKPGVRVDNPGSVESKPWNTAWDTLAPGETKTIQVKFGTNFGKPGYELDPAKVSSAQVFISERQDSASLLISEVKAYGSN